MQKLFKLKTSTTLLPVALVKAASESGKVYANFNKFPLL